MKHDELLAKINNLPQVIGLAEFKARHDALRAVVELHNPNHPWSIPTDQKCAHCSGIDFVEYPCETIQAIEKELS